MEAGKQTIRSSYSIEANESLGEKDKLFRLRIARKEAKETIYWLSIMDKTNAKHSSKIIHIKNEEEELKK